tara:strand:+ start:120 stop:266 length:147 start_codon:yes stop_codon:yes gene_type:complete
MRGETWKKLLKRSRSSGNRGGGNRDSGRLRRRVGCSDVMQLYSRLAVY